MCKKDLTIIERNDSVVRFTVTRRRGGVRQPFDFTGADLEFFLKANVNQADADALATYTSDPGGEIAVVAPPDGGVVDVQMTGADMTAGGYVYHLDAIVNGKRDTVAYGALKVVNV